LYEPWTLTLVLTRFSVRDMMGRGDGSLLYTSDAPDEDDRLGLGALPVVNE
ncbi:hypothetical protein JQN32_25180, partial [Escherichia coli]|nr:hypothetical protein [Escherichia coli]